MWYYVSWYNKNKKLTEYIASPSSLDKQAASSSDNSRADLGGSAVAKLLSANGRYDLHMGQLKYSRSAGALDFSEHA